MGYSTGGTAGSSTDHATLTNVTANQHHTQLHQSAHQSGGGDALTGNLDATARVAVRKNSTGSVYSRRRLNLIEGTNVTITIADDNANEEVDITIDAAGSGGPSAASTVVDELTYGLSSAVGVGTTYARNDHTHGTPTLATSAPSAVTPDAAASAGAAATPSKYDHQHGIATYASTPTDVSATAATAGTSATAPARGNHRHLHAVIASGDMHTEYLKEMTIPFSKGGALSVAVSPFRWYADKSYTITDVRASVGTLPVGSNVRVDVMKNGTSIFALDADKPTIAAAGPNYDVANAIGTTTLVANDYLTVEVETVGSTSPGSDLTVQVLVRRT